MEEGWGGRERNLQWASRLETQGGVDTAAQVQRASEG